MDAPRISKDWDKAWDDHTSRFRFTISDPSTNPLMRIASDGSLYWHGRKVTTDGEFKAAMLALARYLMGDYSED